MKKRIVSVLLCAAMAASLLAGCGESEEKLVIGITNFEPMDYKDEDGISNGDRIARGLAPLDSKTGKPIELHHLGQKPDSPLVELTEEEHRTGEYEDGKKNQSLWHDNTIESEVHGEDSNWDQIRKAHWKIRAETSKR